jgi:PAS domain S-box-containing protein
MGVRGHIGRFWSRGGALAAAVLVLGLLASVTTGLLLVRSENSAASETMDRLVVAAQQTVADQTGKYVDALRVAAGGLGAPAVLTSGIFLATTAPLRQLGLPGANSVAFVVSATDAQVASTQAYWRARGADGLTLAPHGTGVDHYFGIMRQQLDDKTTTAVLGGDANTLPEPVDALVRARRVDEPAISDPYVLVRDRTLPAARQQLSFVLAQPVYAQTDGSFRGWLVMSLRGQDFTGQTLEAGSTGFRTLSLNVTQGGTTRTVASLAGRGRRDDLHRSVQVPVADKTWRLAATADAGVLRGQQPALHLLVMVGGGFVSVVLAGMVLVLGTTRDRIREQFEGATEELRVSERETAQHTLLLRAVMDSIADAVVVVDDAGRLTMRNSAALGLLGPDPDLTAGMFRIDGVSPYPRSELPIERVLAGAGPVGAELVLRNKYRPEGAWLNVAARPLASSAPGPAPGPAPAPGTGPGPGTGGQAGAVAILHDVTDRRRADEQLRASEEQLRLLLDSARDHAIFLLDQNGCVATWSANAERLEGYGAAEIIGRGYETFFLPEDVARGTPGTLMRRAVERGIVPLDGHRIRKDGSRFWAHGNLVAARNPDGSFRGYVEVVQDITARREAEQAIAALNDQLEQRVAQRTTALAERAEELRRSNDELESFSYSVSHDLRAPLRAVDGFAKMLALDYDDRLDDTARRYLARIRAGAQQMGDLIDGLLAFSRLQRQPMSWQPVRVAAIVEDLWEELTVECGDRDLTLVVSEELPPAMGDPRLVRHVLSNLIGNAVKYTRNRASARVEVGYTVTAGGQATYYVRDNGAGFDMRYADKLFKVFQRLHRAEDYEGTGIGLALAHRIVQRHDGRMWADAEPDAGATFYFTLPTAVPVNSEGNHDEAATDAGAAGRGQPRRSGTGSARL